MRRLLFATISVTLLWATPASAHFPFVVPAAGNASATLVMSESLDPDSEVDINLLKGAVLSLRIADGTELPLALTKGEDLMTLPLPGEGTRVVHGLVDLGVMKRGKTHVLLYYPKTIVGDPFDASTRLRDLVPIELVPVRDDAGVRLQLIINGKPAPQTELHIIGSDGKDTEQMTDADGLTAVFETAGRFGAWARHWVDEAGKRDEQAYEQVRNYATLVFDVPAATAAAAAPAARAEAAATLPGVTVRTPLPEAVASFGAVESDGWLYVYGGHTADRHEYSTATISGRFHRLNLKADGKWEELAGGVHIQGLNLAAHNGSIYRAGGMEPRNAPEAAADRFSIAEVARFAPATNEWVALPPLPRPRSSHDLVVVDNQLLAIGGWWLKGKGVRTEWLDTVDVLSLDADTPAWRSIPQPFSRRALIVTALGQKVFVIGGFDAFDTAMLDVDILDVSTGTWTKGPPIPGDESNGFGPAACTLDGSVYLSVGSGDLYRLSDDQTAWEPFTKTTPRIVHRLIPFGDEILVVGGAAEERMLDLIEAVHVDKRQAAPKAAADTEGSR